jgi:hypothetical protein
MKKSIPFLIFFTGMLLYLNMKADKKFVFTYDDNGNRTLLTFTSTCRKKNPKDSTITLKDTISTDVPDTAVLNQLKQVLQPTLYPTLVHTDFLLSFPEDIRNGMLQISDMNGNILYAESGIYTSNTVVRMCDVPAGMYTVTVYYNDNKKPFVQKIIKQ